MTRALFALMLVLSTSSLATADPRPEKRALHVPDHIKLQSGGYLGFATAGIGAAALYDHVALTAYYGWVPAIVGGRDIHSFALTLSARAPRLELASELDWVPLYLGMGALYTRGDGFFTRLPARYPAGYYAPNSLRSFVLLGSELELEKPVRSGFAGHALFVEVVALDLYLHHWAENTGSISPLEVLSTAVGYKARLP